MAQQFKVLKFSELQKLAPDLHNASTTFNRQRLESMLNQLHNKVIIDYEFHHVTGSIEMYLIFKRMSFFKRVYTRILRFVNRK